MYYLRTQMGYGNVIDGKTKKDLREKAIQEIREGKERLLFANFRISKRKIGYSKT